MKVALVSADILPASQSGGIASYTLHLASSLSSRGHDVTIIGATNSRSSEDLRNRIKFVFLPSQKPKLTSTKLGAIPGIVSRALTLSRYLRHFRQFDIVEFPVWNAEGLFSTNVNRFKAVVRGHTPHAVINSLLAAESIKVAKADRLISVLEAITARRSDLFLANSRSSLDSSLRFLKIDPAKSRICYHGIDIPATWKPTQTSSTINILFVGRLEPRKGVDFLLSAFCEVLKTHPQVRLLVVGSDTELTDGSSYKSRFVKNATANQNAAVSFLGRVSDAELKRLWMTCDVACLPSLYESFGLVHVEAMSYGRPVLAFDIPTTAEIIQSGHNGVLVPPKDTESLTDSLNGLVEDKKLRLKIGSEARKTVCERFSLDVMASCVESAYKSLL